MSGKGWGAAAADFASGASRTWLWRALAWNDVKHRYSGSVLGSLWITANIFLLTLCLTFVFSGPLGASHGRYAPYVAIGLVLWYFVQSTLSEAPNTFVGQAETIRHSPLPLSIQVLRGVWRNFLIFAHNAIVIPVVLVAFGITPHPSALFGFAGLLLLGVNLVSATVILGLLGARFRDIQQVMTSALQLLFFVTPIVWFPATLSGRGAWIAAANPIFAFIDIVRAPLLGETPAATSWPMAIGVTVAGAALAAAGFARYRHRVAYWV
jgi:ABC-type polysaccharide/polyol phosphate export permease